MPSDTLASSRTWTNRFFGLIFWISLAVGCATAIVLMFRDTLSTTPMIVTDRDPVFVWQIPTPAITICPDQKIRDAYKVPHFMMLAHCLMHNNCNLKPKEASMIHAQMLTCHTGPRHWLPIQHKTCPYEIVDMIKLMSSQVEYSFEQCTRDGTANNCSRIFQPTITDEGICFTFNMLPREEMFNEETSNDFRSPYNNSDLYDPGLYPHQLYGSGAGTGRNVLSFTPVPGYKWARDCDGPKRIFRVLIHPPHEYPQMNVGAHVYEIPSFLDQVELIITPTVIRTDAKAMDKFTPGIRHCYLPNDRRLQYFAHYSKMNCERECLAEHILHLAECVPYFLPRNSSTPICGFSNRPRYEDEINSFYTEPAGATIKDRCACLDPCESIEYTSESVSISRKRFDSDMYSSVKVFFGASSYDSLVRVPTHDSMDLLIYGNGLYVLLVGISLSGMLKFLLCGTSRLLKRSGRCRFVKCVTER